jgi:hypothetical protein
MTPTLQELKFLAGAQKNASECWRLMFAGIQSNQITSPHLRMSHDDDGGRDVDGKWTLAVR